MESKYWVWTARETSKLETEVLGAPGPEELLVRTLYTGVSPGTEMALYMMTHVGFGDAENHYAEYPHRGGYLSVGVVEEAGADVAAEWPAGTWVFSGSSHRQYSTLRPGGGIWSGCFRLPVELKAPEACFLGMARISYTAVHLAPAVLEEKVAVFGGGLVGNFAAQLYEASGANVILVERDEFRRGIAGECGLSTVSSTGEVVDYFGGAPEMIIEATGVPALCVEAFELVAEGGRVVILSSPRGEAAVNFYNHIHSKVIKVIGAHGKAVKDGAGATRLVVELAAAGKVKMKPCLTHVESWKDAPNVWDAYAGGAAGRLGTVFDWSR